MNFPTFTAEASLYGSGQHRAARALNSRSERSSATRSLVYPSARGQDFPDQKCACKGCGHGGGDVTGKCGSVSKDKTVYSKGSEPYDYCKAAAVWRPPTRIFRISGGAMFGF
jgi:hypothetical protein